MTTAPTASPELPDLDHLEALARAATPGRWMRLFGERTVYDRMEDGCRGNAIVRADLGYGLQDISNLDFIAGANPAAVLELIALARRAAIANQPAPTVSLEDRPEDDQQWAKVDPAVAFHLIERHAEDCADAGRLMLQWYNAISRAAQQEPVAAPQQAAAPANQPAQEQASTTRVTETKRAQLKARGYEVVGYVMQNSVNELCTLAHGRVEWLGKGTVTDYGTSAPGTPEAPSTTCMTEEQAESWAWKQVKLDVGTDGWTAGDSGNYFGFFLWGWRYRAQYQRQRAAQLDGGQGEGQ
jgi:hypothetical protein